MSISSSMEFWKAFTKHGLRLLQMHDQFSTGSSNNGSLKALIKKALGAATVKKGNTS